MLDFATKLLSFHVRRDVVPHGVDPDTSDMLEDDERAHDTVDARLAAKRAAQNKNRGTKQSSEQFLCEISDSLVDLTAESQSEKDSADSFKKIALAMEKQATKICENLSSSKMKQRQKKQI